MPAVLLCAVALKAVAVSDLSVHATRPQTTLVYGGIPFEFALYASNAGPDDASNVVLSISWDQGLFLKSQSVPDFFGDTYFGLVITNFPAHTSVEVTLEFVPTKTGELFINGYIYEYLARSDPDFGDDLAYVSLEALPGPGVLSFAKRGWSIREGNTAIVEVIRTGGNRGELAVSYATSNAAAIAHSDFLPQTGRLTFAEGQDRKTIEISSIADAAIECNEVFSVNLFNPGEGIFVAPLSNTTVVIFERHPPRSGYARPLSYSLADPRVLVGADLLTALSADGRKLVFGTRSPSVYSMMPTQSNRPTVVIHDLTARSNSRVTSPNPADFPLYPVISGDGRTVVFSEPSSAHWWGSSLLVHDLATGVTTSLAPETTNQSYINPMIASNGAVLVFEEQRSTVFGIVDYPLVTHNRLTGSNQIANVSVDGLWHPGHYGTFPTLSADGRFVVFESLRPDVVGNDTNGLADVFRRDLVERTTELVSVNTSGTGSGNGASYGAGVMSADGRYVAFLSLATDLAGTHSSSHLRLYLRDMLTGITRLVSPELSEVAYPSLSADGRFIAYESFIGSYIPFPDSFAMSDIYCTDMQDGTTILISSNCAGTGGGNAYSYDPRMSGDGRYVFFHGYATDFMDGDFLPGEYNVFRWDRVTGERTLVTANMSGSGGISGQITLGGISFDGNTAVFTSTNANLVFGDLNNAMDAFVWTAGSPPNLMITRSNDFVTVSWPVDSPPAVLEAQPQHGNWQIVPGPFPERDGQTLYRTQLASGFPLLLFRLRLL